MSTLPQSYALQSDKDESGRNSMPKKPTPKSRTLTLRFKSDSDDLEQLRQMYLQATATRRMSMNAWCIARLMGKRVR